MNTGEIREILSKVVSKDPEVMKILRNLRQERKKDLALLKAEEDLKRVRQGSDHLIHRMVYNPVDSGNRRLPERKVKVPTIKPIGNGNYVYDEDSVVEIHPDNR